MKIEELTKWLRLNSSGVYRPSAEAANLIEHMAKALIQLSDCNINDKNCASFDVANKRIRNIANAALKWE